MGCRPAGAWRWMGVIEKVVEIDGDAAVVAKEQSVSAIRTVSAARHFKSAEVHMDGRLCVIFIVLIKYYLKIISSLSDPPTQRMNQKRFVEQPS